jgi:hypothetical protein
MSNVLKSLGDATRTGLTWAIVWAPVAVLIGTVIIDPDNSMDEMWAAIGAYPGFLAGVVFFAMLRAFSGHKIETLSASSTAMWGGLSSLAVLGIAVLVTDLARVILPSIWMGFTVVTGVMLLGALAASVSRATAGWWNERGRVAAHSR